jgi:hypothetical protein
MIEFKLQYRLPLSGEHKPVLYAKDKLDALHQFITLWMDVNSVVTPEIISITQTTQKYEIQ